MASQRPFPFQTEVARLGGNPSDPLVSLLRVVLDRVDAATGRGAANSQLGSAAAIPIPSICSAAGINYSYIPLSVRRDMGRF